MSRRPENRLTEAERSIADALAAIDYLRATMAADAGMLREILARRDRDAATLAKIRADLAERLRPAAALCCALLALRLSAPAAEPSAALPAPPTASALTPGPLHSATNLSPAEARAALASALPPPSESAVAAFLAPSGRDLPGFVSAGVWVDALALPVGLFETATPATVSSPSSALLCTPEHVRGVVWRWRRGTGPRAVPLDLDHDSATNAAYSLMGRVVGAWFDEDRGGVFRVELTPAGAEAVTNASAPLRLSPELRVVTATNAAGDRLSIPWALRSLALTADPALPTPALRAADLRPLSEISVYPRAR